MTSPALGDTWEPAKQRARRRRGANDVLPALVNSAPPPEATGPGSPPTGYDLTPVQTRVRDRLTWPSKRVETLMAIQHDIGTLGLRGRARWGGAPHSGSPSDRLRGTGHLLCVKLGGGLVVERGQSSLFLQKNV